MNKVIAALDSFKPSASTIDYSIYLAKEFNAHIVATFLEDITYHAQPTTGEDNSALTDWSKVEDVLKNEDQIHAESKNHLQAKFDAAGVHYNVHRDKRLALESLIKESRYADLILIDGNEKFSNWDSSKPSQFLKSVLSDADCPVLVVPPEYKKIEKFVFAYDGSPSSVYAIKQFSYLFPVSAEQQVEILMVTDDNHTNHFPNQHLLKELLKRKYSTILQSIIKSSNTDDAFVSHMKTENKNSVLILGAYQRSSFSRWLYQSIADSLISRLELPIFIAHK